MTLARYSWQSFFVFTLLVPILYAQDQNPKTLMSKYVFTQAGELPIILSAPHGGTGTVPGVEKRNVEGLPTGGAGFVVARDTGTEELAHDVANAIQERLGKLPYQVISRTHRQYLDPNRPSDIAYDDSDAKPIYDFYHKTIEEFVRK